MTPSPSNAVLLQMIEQNDDKHEAGHRRLRADLTEGVNTLTDELARLEAAQAKDHDLVVTLWRSRERRKELSMNKAVIIAAAIGACSQLFVTLIQEVVTWVRG